MKIVVCIITGFGILSCGIIGARNLVGNTKNGPKTASIFCDLFIATMFPVAAFIISYTQFAEAHKIKTSFGNVGVLKLLGIIMLFFMFTVSFDFLSKSFMGDELKPWVNRAFLGGTVVVTVVCIAVIIAVVALMLF